jgi:hypothetical protein
VKGAFFYNINEASQKESHEHQYCEKTIPAQSPEVNRIGIKKDDFNIKQHKEDGYQKILILNHMTKKECGVGFSMDTKIEIA